MQHIDNLYCGNSANLVKVAGVLFPAAAYGRYVINAGILLVSTLVFIHVGFCKNIKYKFAVICLLQPDTNEFE